MTAIMLRPQDCAHRRVRGRQPYNGLGDCLDCGGLTWLWLTPQAGGTTDA